MSNPVFTLPAAAEHAISIRAKALTFEDAHSRVLLDRVRLVAPSDATALSLLDSRATPDIDTDFAWNVHG